jgi:hypothetical protein
MKKKGAGKMRRSAACSGFLAAFLLLGCFGCSGNNTVNISTSPQGAKLYVNDQYVGLTPKSLSQSWRKYSGETLNLRIEKKGYKTFYKTIQNSELRNLHMSGNYKSGSEYGVGLTYDFPFILEEEPGDASPGRTVRCDLRVIQVSDGAALASASGEAASDKLANLSKALAGKLREDLMVKGESIAVVSLRNRGNTPQGKVVADELADKLSNALIDGGFFDVKERIDLRTVVEEKDLDSAGLVKNQNVRPKLSVVKYIVVGGVTVDEPQKP